LCRLDLRCPTLAERPAKIVSTGELPHGRTGFGSLIDYNAGRLANRRYGLTNNATAAV